MDIPRLRQYGVEIPEVEAKRKEINENHRELRMTQSQLTVLKQQREQARVVDTQAAVKARREGKKDPGARAERKLEAEIEQVTREISVLEGLAAELEAEASELMSEHAEEIQAALIKTLQEINHEQLDALAKVEVARSQRLQLTSTLQKTVAATPAPPVEEGREGGQDTVTIMAHHGMDSIMRVGEDQIQKVLAHLRAEAGDTGQRDMIAEQENPPADVNFAGTAGMAVPAGKAYYEQRKAERVADEGA